MWVTGPGIVQSPAGNVAARVYEWPSTRFLRGGRRRTLVRLRSTLRRKMDVRPYSAPDFSGQ